MPSSYLAIKPDSDTATGVTAFTSADALAGSTGPRALKMGVEVGLVAPASESSASEGNCGVNFAGATTTTQAALGQIDAGATCRGRSQAFSPVGVAIDIF